MRSWSRCGRGITRTETQVINDIGIWIHPSRHARGVNMFWRAAATGLVVALTSGVAARASTAQTGATAATAATAATTASPLVLGDLYRAVRRDSPRAAAARALARAADARVPGASLPPDPQLQFGFMNYELPGLRPMDPLGMTQLQLMQMVPLAGKLRLTGRVAGAQAAAATQRAADVEWELRAQTAMAFYDVYQAEQALVVETETLRLLEDTRRLAEAMYRVGDGRQADVLRAHVELAKMVEDTVRMTTMRTAMVARLGALLNRQLPEASGTAALPLFPDSVPPLAELIALADSGRPMVNAGRRDVDAATTQGALARREIWPDLAVGVQLGQRPGEGGMGTDRMGSLMIGASLPIFARNRQLRMREEAAAMRQMAEADLAAMRAATHASVAEAHANLTRARHLAVLYRTTILPQAEAAVTSSLSAYRVGSVDFMTLLDNRMTVNRYRQELSVLESDEGKAWAELEMLTGRELFDADRVTRRVSAVPPPPGGPQR
jgi:cobalt-zinc-cadmium efflux system outer membrane protein